MLKVLNYLVDFLFPKTCISCSSYLKNNNFKYLCQRCFDSIEFIKPLYCRKCGIPLPFGGEHCYRCLNHESKIYYEILRGVCIYDGVIRKCIHLFKYSGRDYLAGFFAPLLAEYILKDEHLNSAQIIIPVPLHPYKNFLRGYNQSELLSSEVSRLTGKISVKNKLVRTRYTKPQVNLDRDERLKNVSDAFVVKEKDIFKDKKIIIIDDVSTTGETINQCAKVLLKAGAETVYGLVAARDV